jgi:hypothetical protein
METYCLLRNTLVRMIDETRVPTQADLETLLFSGADTSTEPFAPDDLAARGPSA